MKTKTRIFYIRTHPNVNLSQEEFGSKINIKSRGHISALENGTKDLTERMIKDIVREFNVNEEWLRTGEGEMFRTLTPDQELADFVGGLFSDDCEPRKKEFFLAMSKLPDEFFIQMMKAFEEVQEEKEKRED